MPSLNHQVAASRSGESEHTAFAQSNVNAIRALDLPGGVQIRQYTNEHERLFYEDGSIHTFSMYLRGGYQTRRTDINARRGAPGRFCLMPVGSYSAWEIGDEQDFVHIYFGDTYIKRLALETFDTDPRQLELPHLTFNQGDALLGLMQHSMLCWDWHQTDNHMVLQQGLQTLLLNLLKTVGIKRIDTDKPLIAGLSPRVQQRVRDYIESNLNRSIVLSELATTAGLSEYHFARMFKISFADTPQGYISQRRIDRLKIALTSNRREAERSLAQLALEHGFSSQSHMGRVFKQLVGTTPAQFARCGKNASKF